MKERLLLKSKITSTNLYYNWDLSITIPKNYTTPTPMANTFKSLEWGGFYSLSSGSSEGPRNGIISEYSYFDPLLLLITNHSPLIEIVRCFIQWDCFKLPRCHSLSFSLWHVLRASRMSIQWLSDVFHPIIDHHMST